jgi:hypothetical protein
VASKSRASVGSATFTLVVRVGSKGAEGDTIHNTVSIGSAVGTDPIGTNNSAAADTALARTACAPRPHVATDLVQSGDGRLRVTVSASTNQGFSNPLRALTWTRFDNTTVEVVGVGNAVPGQRTDLPTGTQSATILVSRGTPGQAATVHLVATDACGDWPTFFGGGPNAWGGASTGAAIPTPVATPPARVPAPAPIVPSPAAACAPRPPIGMRTEAAGPDRLQVTITAGQGGLARLALGSVTNAEVDIGDQTGLGSNAVVPLAGAPPQVTFLVRRLDGQRPATVPLTITDGCGDWRTLVGGGPGAF